MSILMRQGELSSTGWDLATVHLCHWRLGLSVLRGLQPGGGGGRNFCNCSCSSSGKRGPQRAFISRYLGFREENWRCIQKQSGIVCRSGKPSWIASAVLLSNVYCPEICEQKSDWPLKYQIVSGTLDRIRIGLDWIWDWILDRNSVTLLGLFADWWPFKLSYIKTCFW